MAQRTVSIAIFSFLASLVLAIPLALAESLPPSDSVLPTVHIQKAALSPAEATVAMGGSVVLTNRSTAMARVEFRLPRGKGIECSTDGRMPTRGRKFVIDDGDTLLCNTPPGRYDYTVYRNVRLDSGVHRQNVSKGRIQVR